MTRSTSGQRTKYTSSSMAPVVACGCPRKPRTPCCCIIRPGAVWDTSVPYGCGMESFSFLGKQVNLTRAVTFFAFLKGLRRTSIRTGRRVVVITDNARYHHARLHKEWRATHVEDFVLDYLPPYSPELNPIERVWKLTRRQCLHNRYFPILEEVVAAVEKQFDNWRNGNETLRRLCAIT